MSLSNIPKPDEALCIENKASSALSLSNTNVSTIEKEEDTTKLEDENEIKVVSEEIDIIEKYDDNGSLNSGSSNPPDQQGTQ